MAMFTSDLVRELLRQPESESLDFKRRHCSTKAPDSEKSKILKDLLAFANADRKEPAYILIGVDEAELDRGGIVVGIPEDELRDEAELQDFVRRRLNNTLNFSYDEVLVEGKWLGVFAVDVKQVRPLFAHEDFGEVRANAVYRRAGSATVNLTPNEIAAMVRVSPPKAFPRSQKLDGSTKGLVRRWLRVFEVHGVQRSQIPLLLPAFNIRLSHLAEERDVADLLTEELRGATCELFNVSRDWLEEGDRHRPQDAIFPSPDMHQPLRVLERLLCAAGGDHYVTLVGLKSRKGELFGNEHEEPCGFVIRTTLITIANRDIHAFYPIAGLNNWNYPKHRYYAKRLILAAESLECHAQGFHASKAVIQSVCEGECFAEPICRSHCVTWHPDDYAYIEGESAVAKDCEHLVQIIAQAKADGFCTRLQNLRTSLEIERPYVPGVLDRHWQGDSSEGDTVRAV